MYLFDTDFTNFHRLICEPRKLSGVKSGSKKSIMVCLTDSHIDLLRMTKSIALILFPHDRIAIGGRTNGLEYIKYCAPNHFYTNKTRLFEKETGRFAQKIVILQNS
jgi:hypothetical protein